MYCEFGRGGYNWLVSNLSILLYKLAAMFFQISIPEGKFESKNFCYYGLPKLSIRIFIAD